MINFTEWDQRKRDNQQIRADWDTIKAHVTANKELQNGSVCIEGDEVVWMASAEKERALEQHRLDIFSVIDGLVYPV